MEETDFHYCLWHHLPWLKSPQKRALFQHFDQPKNAYCASSAELSSLGLGAASIKRWQQFGLAPFDHPDVQDVIAHRSLLEGVQFIRFGDSRYPQQLAEINQPPEALYLRGNAAALQAPSIAIVGSRRCTKAGEQHALSFGKALANTGFTVISGGALGIDAAAHKGALQAGATVAVTATGIDQCYPSAHRAMYQAIIDNGGAVVTEFRPQVAAKAGHFPKRNRIIAGLSLGTLVIEAAMRSGSLITARLALENGREVFAVPGAIDNVMAKGCNYLIKQGAKLTEDVHDIAEEFAQLCAPTATQALAPETMSSAPEEDLLLRSIDFGFTPLETIAERTGKAVHELLPALLALELAGAIANEGGGYTRM